MARLAQDVGLSQTLLYQTLASYRLNPILHACAELPWSDCRLRLEAGVVGRFRK